jgi:hypothetical protein
MNAGDAKELFRQKTLIQEIKDGKVSEIYRKGDDRPYTVQGVTKDVVTCFRDDATVMVPVGDLFQTEKEAKSAAKST